MPKGKAIRLKIAYVDDIFDDIKTGSVLSAKRFVERLRKNHDVTVISSGHPAADKIIISNFYIPFLKHLMEKNQFIFAYPNQNIIKKTLRMCT